MPDLEITLRPLDSFLLLPLLALCGPRLVVAQDAADFQRLGTWIQPIPGSLVLAGSQDPPDCVVDVLLERAGGRTAVIGVLGGGKRKGLGKRLVERGALDVRGIAPLPARGKARDAALLAWLELDGVWLGERASPGDDPTTDALVLEVARRGGVVGAGGAAVEALLASDRAREQPLLPFVVVRAGSGAGDPVPGAVQFAVDEDAALIVHTGRRVCGYGTGGVVASVAGTDSGWRALRQELEVIDVLDPGDRPSYALDLLAWMRAAQDRVGPVFPAAEPVPVEISRGTLVLQGGGGVSDATWEAFVAAAGGKDARFACVPSANDFEPGEDVRSYSAGQLRERGCSHVTVCHAPGAASAHADARLHELLQAADAVWIDGGRTFRFMDHYQGTTVAALLAEVLRRGGVVGGSSAGCQVLGEFLVRGDPRSNRVLVQPGYTRGLGLLPGVVLDAHFLQRERDTEFRELVANHPQLLGIGVDENTALVVEGRVARVLGENRVSFVDLRENRDGEPVRLRSGESYDLKERGVKDAP